MHKVSMKIWGRKFKLGVMYECFDDDISDAQENALNEFLDGKSELELIQEKVKKYCTDDEMSDGVKTIDNIFKYVIPKNIYVMRSERHHKIALICNYKFDPEHGMVITFKDGKVSTIDDGGSI